MRAPHERAAAVAPSPAGTDVGTAALDVARGPGGQPWRCANDEAGSAERVALTARMHKLLTLLHAVLRDRTPWQPTPLAT